MKNEPKTFWDFFKNKGLSDYAVAGLMGNLFAEGGFKPNNLQNSFEKKLGMNDVQYTAAVDNGTYTNFVKDSAGYGIAQWTYWNRKQNLLNFAKSRNVSIADLEMQLDFLWQELSTSYKGVLESLKGAKSVRQASDIVLKGFEKPKDQSDAVQIRRAAFGQSYYNQFANKTKADTKQGEKQMSNSPLVVYTKISPHKSHPRNHKIDTITIHCMAAPLSIESCGNVFQTRQASSNYGIGPDGRIGLYVDEADRSWATSNKDNDNRAVTIEVACEKTHPYKVTDAAYNALVNLLVDICKRNGIAKLLWRGDKSLIGQVDKQNMTVHRWFANKACPGDYLYNLHGQIADAVNLRLEGKKNQSASKAGSGVPFKVRVDIDNLPIRKGPGKTYPKTGKVTGKGKFTIVKVKNDFGFLKSGQGWINLKRVTRV